LVNFFAIGGWLAAIYFLPLYWQVSGDYSAAEAGALLVPTILASVCGSLFGGFYMKRKARYWWLTMIAYVTLTIGLTMVLLFAGVISKNLPLMIVGACICGFTNGIGITTTLISLIANVSHSDQAVATACSYLFRSLGSIFGISMCATAFNQTLRQSLASALQGSDDADKIAKRVRAGLSYFRSLDPELKEIVRECYGKATRAALSVSLGLVVCSAVAAYFIKEKSLEGGPAGVQQEEENEDEDEE
jgi:MFS family permease